MKDLLEKCCGLDVHKDIIVACILSGPIGKTTVSEIREFSTLASGLTELRDWITASGCSHVAMESTGIYWIALYEVLEAAPENLTLLVVNARHMKNVPGKKTDMRDAEWIATLLRAGLLNASFIPEKSIREPRHLTRYRKSIVHDITSQKNRIEKFLQSSGFRLSSFVSDIFGVTGRGIILHLIKYGSIDRNSLNKCLKTKTRHRLDEILAALNGTLSAHQRDFLNLMLEHYDTLRFHLAEVETSILNEASPKCSQVEQLITIPGISATASISIIAEIGTDMGSFKTAEHICSWAGLSPGNNESAGKRKSTSVTKGNPYVKSMLCEVAWVIAGKRNCYLSAWYWKLKQKKGAKKAIIALARKFLVIIYTMLKYGTNFDESFFETRRKMHEQNRTSHYIRELEKLGFRIELPA